MKILYNGKWITGFLNYSAPKEFKTKKIQILNYYILNKIDDQFIQFNSRASKFWKVYNYLWIYGVKDTFIKIKSRIKENIRNDKYLCCGYGICEEEGVFFLAPNHQFGYDEINLPSEFIFVTTFKFQRNELKIFDLRQLESEIFVAYKGFSIYSGNEIRVTSIKSEISSFEKLLNRIDEDKFLVSKTPLENDLKLSRIGSLENKVERKESRLKAILFGYGNYSKSIIIPNFYKKGISLIKIHEIDPIQLYEHSSNTELSCNPYFDEDDKKDYDVYVVAGYHHTHVELALHGLRRKAFVIIEKPLATTLNQYNQFLDFVTNNESTFFICFQKRYSIFNKYIHRDLSILKGDSLNYYAMVYEESLGNLHWYNWPNSQTRIISNGCHWIDHFLFLNNYSPAISYDAEFINVNDIVVKIILENGSSFILILTDSGSKHLGVREYIRISSKNSTVDITDNQYYKAENEFKVIRKKTYGNKLHNLKSMYKDINDKIVKQEAGDSIKSLQSSLLSIQLNEKLKENFKSNETTHTVL